MFSELLHQYGWASVAGSALLGVFSLVMYGKLVPIRQHREIRTDRDYWRELAQKTLTLLTDTVGSLNAQVQELVDQTSMTEKILDAVHRAAQQDKPPEGTSR